MVGDRRDGRLRSGLDNCIHFAPNEGAFRVLDADYRAGFDAGLVDCDLGDFTGVGGKISRIL